MKTEEITPETTKAKGKEYSYVCVHCNRPVSSLYITYSDPSNTSLLQCPRCGNLSDEYMTLEFPVLLVDLLLFKPRVYRHLLTNRGPSDPRLRERERMYHTWKIGSITMGLDAIVRCANVGPPESSDPISLYFKVLSYCVLETLSLHACIALASILIQFIFRSPRSASLSRLRLLPLTLFYTSLPTLFLLFITSLIWAHEYSLPSYPSSTASHLDFPALLAPVFLPLLGALPDADDGALKSVSWLSRQNLKSGVSTFGNVRGWANEAALRKGIGGSSAVVGVSGEEFESMITHSLGLLRPHSFLLTVLLNASQPRTVLILIIAWLMHLYSLHLMDPYVT